MKPSIAKIFGSSFIREDGTYKDEISQREINLLFEHRLLKLFLPKELNGLGLTLCETMRIIREASFVNGSLGWLIQIGNGGNYFASCFPEDIARTLFSPEDSVIAGSGMSTGNVIACEGGFRISGTWPYCSGADFASLFTFSFQDPLTGEQVAGIVSKEVVHVLNDWDTIGLKNSSTHSIQLSDVYVPSDHVFRVDQQHYLLDNPSFCLPFVIYAQLFFIQVLIGIVDRILFEAKLLHVQKKEIWKEVYPGKNERLSALFERVASSIASFHTRTYELTIYYQQGGDETKVDTHRKKVVYYAKTLKESAHEIVAELGLVVVQEKHSVSIFYRDLIVAGQHYLLRE